MMLARRDAGHRWYPAAAVAKRLLVTGISVMWSCVSVWGHKAMHRVTPTEAGMWSPCPA